MLAEAEAILVADGYAALTMRRVADRAGISLGNLQHYFPTRLALVEALLEAVGARLRAQFGARVRQVTSPRERVEAAVDALIENVTAEDRFVPMWEIWSMATHDPSLARIVDRAYARLFTECAALIAEADPRVSAGDAISRARLIVALVEGAGFFAAPRRLPAKEREAFMDALRAQMRSTALPDVAT